MKTFMLLFTGCILLSSFSTRGKQKDKIAVEFYITPRNAKYGWYNNGVENFDFKRKSIKVAFDKRTYTTLTETDSLYELYHVRKVFNKDILEKMIYKSERAIDDTLDIKRIAIIIHRKGGIDTIFVDRNYIFSLRSKLYKVSKEFSSFLEGLMPVGIKENWINDLPAML